MVHHFFGRLISIGSIDYASFLPQIKNQTSNFQQKMKRAHNEVASSKTEKHQWTKKQRREFYKEQDKKLAQIQKEFEQKRKQLAKKQQENPHDYHPEINEPPEVVIEELRKTEHLFKKVFFRYHEQQKTTNQPNGKHRQHGWYQERFLHYEGVVNYFGESGNVRKVLNAFREAKQ